VDPIGGGASGVVYRAWDTKLRRYVAVKLLRHADGGSLARFVREQSLRVEHPHVLAPIAWAADDDRALLVMDLVSGGSVSDLLGDFGPLPLWHVGVLVDQLLAALAAIHAKGIVHRDVKPSNLLLEATGKGKPFLRLADFGIAAVTGEPRLTNSVHVAGTPGYVAPECKPGNDPEPRQDLYSAGVVARHLLTGHADMDEIVQPQGVPDPMWRLVVSLIAPSPEQRPASASAALGAWRAATASLTPARAADSDPVEVFDHLGPLPEGFDETGPARDGPRPTPRRRRSPATGRAAVAAGLAVLVAAAGFAIHMVGSRNASTSASPSSRGQSPSGNVRTIGTIHEDYVYADVSVRIGVAIDIDTDAHTIAGRASLPSGEGLVSVQRVALWRVTPGEEAVIAACGDVGGTACSGYQPYVLERTNWITCRHTHVYYARVYGYFVVRTGTGRSESR